MEIVAHRFAFSVSRSSSPRVFVGYRCKELLALSKPLDVADGIRVSKTFHQHDGLHRGVEMVTSPFFYVGAALPHPDTRSPESLLRGFNGRMGRKLPEVEIPGYFGRLKSVTREWIKRRKLCPVSADNDFDFYVWLNSRNLTLKRRAEFIAIHEEVVDLLERNNSGELKNFKVKLFCKDEQYTDFKMNRGIYAREDVAKVFFGPAFHAIEEELYKQPEFIKHVPVKDRGAYIFKMLYEDGAKYVATDYSAYECHFTKERMENCEFVLYEHMLNTSPMGKYILDVMREVLQGDNLVMSKFFTGVVSARRMSGEMNTSLGNGFGNLMMMTETCLRINISWDNIIGVVEGDDGLFRFTSKSPSREDFTIAGCDIKLNTYDRISDASFCGLLFDETDQQVIKDPYDIITSIGLLTKQYAKARRGKKLALLRAKALSTLYQYPGCPIVAEIAKYIIRETKHIDMRNVFERCQSFDSYHRELYLEALKHHQYQSDLVIGMGTRLLFQELYGIPVDVQLRLESHFKNLVGLVPFQDDFLDYCMSTSNEMRHWQEYYDLYSVADSGNIDPHCVNIPSYLVAVSPMDSRLGAGS